MKWIRQVSIVYMFAALLFAQPATHGINFKDFCAAPLEGLRQHIGTETLVRGSIITAVIGFLGYFGYSLWALSSNRAVSESFDSDVDFKNDMIYLLDIIFENRARVWKFEPEYRLQIHAWKKYFARQRHIVKLIDQFANAFKAYADHGNDSSAEHNLTVAYKQLKQAVA